MIADLVSLDCAVRGCTMYPPQKIRRVGWEARPALLAIANHNRESGTILGSKIPRLEEFGRLDYEKLAHGTRARSKLLLFPGPTLAPLFCRRRLRNTLDRRLEKRNKSQMHFKHIELSIGSRNRQSRAKSCQSAKGRLPGAPFRLSMAVSARAPVLKLIRPSSARFRAQPGTMQGYIRDKYAAKGRHSP